MTCPDHLYKYRAFDTRTLELILENKVYFADPNNFNDPHEFQPELVLSDDPFLNMCVLHSLINQNQHNRNMTHQSENYPESANIDSEYDAFLTDLKSQQIFEKEYSIETVQEKTVIQLKEYLSRGVLSLSGSKESTLMWSHYADNHFGLCLGYTIPEVMTDKIYKVNYDGSRFVQSKDIMIMLGSNTAARQRIINSSLVTKSECWAYEEEYRLFEVKPGVTDIGLDLKEIIFGLRMKKSVRDAIINAIKHSDNKRLSEVKFFKMEVLNPGGFELHAVPID
ncbi:DUF2971 domain-containing protein [Buttiauxella selenatireducens]|uniref:DUF2971 domain-containing protein n=1 Tax=Buttiauxella selenatireducens TaxID=3073902 RepID=A0ABY9SE17_9ENTR|nr:DUF2971 domain-containing protein [Buttiauxella sp. R73]WMY75745.1 DUF2971 domain-containing protein [Buttiauxella sp. R73]